MKFHCSARPHTTALLVLPLPPGRGKAGMGVESCQWQLLRFNAMAVAAEATRYDSGPARFDPLPPLPLPGGGSNTDVWRKT